MARAKKMALFEEPNPEPEVEPQNEPVTEPETEEPEVPEDPQPEEPELPVTELPTYVVGATVGNFPTLTFGTHHVGDELAVLKHLLTIYYCIVNGLEPSLVTVS
jgi:hypothetical protein